jgi:hypothetical protein
MIALQIKSGASFFEIDDGESWRFYPEEKHRIYWERFPIPVILVLHQPEAGESFWIDVRHAYRRGAQDEKIGVSVPKVQTFSATTGFQLFENVVVTAEAFLESLETVLRTLVSTRTTNASFPLSYFQMFAGGLTNIVRSLHFGMDLVTNLVEMNLAFGESDYGMGLGAEEYDFVFGYVKFLVAQDLADIDFGDCLVDWNDREMVPRFVAPLTRRGRDLVRIIGDREDQLRSAGLLPEQKFIRVAQEHFVQMVVSPSDVERVPLIAAFEANILTPL